MNNRAMADGNILADHDRGTSTGRVYHRVFLDIAPSSDPERLKVAAQHCSEEDRDIGLDDHIPRYPSSRRHKSSGADQRKAILERDDAADGIHPIILSAVSAMLSAVGAIIFSRALE